MTDIRRIFKGRNFMTPNPIEYYKGEVRGRVAYIELAEGKNLEGGPLYGVTFRREDGSELWREDIRTDPSDCFRDKSKAMKRITDHKGVPIE